METDYKHIICKVNNELECKKIQEIAFEHGYSWAVDGGDQNYRSDKTFIILKPLSK